MYQTHTVYQIIYEYIQTVIINRSTQYCRADNWGKT